MGGIERPLRVGLVCHPTYGGSGVLASELGLALADRGHQVHFFSHSLPFRVPGGRANTHFHEVEVISYPLFKYPPYTLALANKLTEAHRQHPFDLLHVHYAIPHAIAGYLCRQMLGDSSPKIITTLHGTDITIVGLDSSFFEITRFSLEHSDGVTAVSNYLAQETRKRFQPGREIRVIPNFVDEKVFTPELRSNEKRLLYARTGEMLIGHLSNFRPVKRARDVVRVFHLIQKQLPARLIMIGEGVDQEPARHLARELGIEERVYFLGVVTAVAQILAQLDLFLLPSKYESFGLAALEAMASGVPVIATRAGGLPEVVEDGVSGMLCEVGDADSMARVALEILANRERHEAMSAAARRRAVEKFPQERMVSLYEEYYREALDGTRS